MITRISKLFLPLLLCLCLIPSLAFAADADSAGHNEGDVTIVRQIISQSPTLTAEYGPTSGPGDWDFVKFDSEGRVSAINFEDIEGIKPVADYEGALDVSGLTKLSTLWCSNNPGITSIALPSSITYFSGAHTGITSLDVSHCENLEILYCSSTNISELDISHNPNLYELNCMNTNVKNLDISNNDKIDTLDAGFIDSLTTPKGKFLFRQTDSTRISVEGDDWINGNIRLEAEPYNWGESGVVFKWYNVPESAIYQHNLAFVNVDDLDVNKVISVEIIKPNDGGESAGAITSPDNASGEKDTSSVLGTPKTGDMSTAFAASAVALVACALSACAFTYRKMRTNGK